MQRRSPTEQSWGTDLTISSLSEQRIRKALVKLFIAFPVRAEREFKLDTYVEALSRIPPSFVEEAVDYAIRGKLNGGRFLPNSGELVQLAEELQARTLRNGGRPKFSWEKPDTPVQNTQQQRFKIIQGFRQLLRDIRTGTPIDPDRDTAKIFKED